MKNEPSTILPVRNPDYHDFSKQGWRYFDGTHEVFVPYPKPALLPGETKMKMHPDARNALIITAVIVVVTIALAIGIGLLLTSGHMFFAGVLTALTAGFIAKLAIWGNPPN